MYPSLIRSNSLRTEKPNSKYVEFSFYLQRNLNIINIYNYTTRWLSVLSLCLKNGAQRVSMRSEAEGTVFAEGLKSVFGWRREHSWYTLLTVIKIETNWWQFFFIFLFKRFRFIYLKNISCLVLWCTIQSVLWSTMIDFFDTMIDFLIQWSIFWYNDQFYRCTIISESSSSMNGL